jgi:hypothetical protein
MPEIEMSLAEVLEICEEISALMQKQKEICEVLEDIY